MNRQVTRPSVTPARRRSSSWWIAWRWIRL